MSVSKIGSNRRFKLCAGVAAGFCLISYLSYERGIPLLIAPLASTACILVAMPDGAYNRPRNIILGHVLSAVTGIFIRNVLAVNWLSAVLCVALSIALMSAAGATHPPAAATSLLALETDRGYGFIMMPVAIGALILVLSARIADFSIKK